MFEALLGACRVGDIDGVSTIQSRTDVNNTLAIGAGLVHENLPFLLNHLKGGGIPWFASRYGQARNYRGTSIGSGKSPIEELLGIRRWREEKRPSFQWLVAETGDRHQVQLLFRERRFVGAFDVSRCGLIDFQGSNPEILMAEIRIREKKIGEFDFGLIQARKPQWIELKSILQDAYCWSELLEKREVFVIGKPCNPNQVVCSGRYESPRGRTFQHIVKLAFARYRPEYLRSEMDECLKYPLGLWTPILVFHPTEMNARGRLLAEVKLREWIKKGGARLEDIEVLTELDLERVERFVAAHSG